MNSDGSAHEGSITTHSVAEGLDFACNLLASSLANAGNDESQKSAALLRTLAEYISFRYTGEYGLAFEYLDLLADDLGEIADVRWSQFWNQMKWLSSELDIPIRTTRTG